MFSCGDLIEATSPKGIDHWAVYIGDGDIVHVPHKNKGGLCTVDRDKLSVLNDSYKRIVKNNNYDYYESAYSAEDIKSRALSSVGETWDYDLLFHNCEHFAKWCRNGKYKSQQGPNSDSKCLWHDEEYWRQVNEEGREMDDDYVGGIFEHDAQLATSGANGPLKVDLLHVGAGELKDGYGFRNGIEVLAVDVKGVSAQAGFDIDTGVVCKNGSFGGKLLGTGVTVGKKMEVSFLGNRIGIDFGKIFGKKQVAVGGTIVPIKNIYDLSIDIGKK